MARVKMGGYRPLPATCRLAVCQICNHREIIDADNDQPECPRCDGGSVISTRVHPRADAIALLIAPDPFFPFPLQVPS